jgi:aryl-alcohol dehydrogenase-like predicted oxidoreductase
VRYVGASNYPAWRLALAIARTESGDLTRYEALQPNYSLVKRSEFERELRPLCEALGIGVIPYSPLGAGFLTGKYRRGESLPRSARANSVSNRYGDDERAWQALDTVIDIAAKRATTPAQVALAWLLAQPTITAPIIGANSVDQLRELVGAVDVQLTRPELKRLDAASGGAFEWND